MATLTAPMTIEQFDQAGFPENYELHGGVPVEMSVARAAHRIIQTQILHRFERVFPDAWVQFEMPFQIGVTNDERSADLGVTSLDRQQAALAGNGMLKGAPEIVVEVLSPSNSALELKAYQTLCFGHGTQIFLTVDPSENTVAVRRKGSRSEETWGKSEEFILEIWGESHTFPVRDFFPNIPEKP